MWSSGWRRRVSEGKWKLGEAQRREIVAVRGQESPAELARRYGVGKTTIWRVWRRESVASGG